MYECVCRIVSREQNKALCDIVEKYNAIDYCLMQNQANNQFVVTLISPDKSFPEQPTIDAAIVMAEGE
jgi:hypothetical protein